MVSIRGLEKSYKGFKVLRGLNMNIKKGSVYGFIGKNGCGKTTTMNILCNIIKKDRGEIFFENGSIKIGYLPETPSLYHYMYAEEYLFYIAACAKIQNPAARIHEVLELTKMNQIGKRKIKGYSRGMIQRLGIAAVILNNPDLLILDEPTSALDPEGRADIMEIIGNISLKGGTILLCTHILSDVERVADTIGIVSNGVIVAEGSQREIKSSYGKSKGITIRLSDYDADKYQILRGCPLVAASFQNKDGNYIFVSNSREENSEKELCAQLLNIIHTENIIPEKIEINKPTLESAYFEAVMGSNIGAVVTPPSAPQNILQKHTDSSSQGGNLSD